MNGKGDTPRKKTVSEETWGKNWSRVFGKKDCSVEVEIIENGEKSKGYILRRISSDTYEIWCEKQQKAIYLCKNEFKEIN